MKQYVVNDPRGQRLQAVRQSDEATAGGARTPALLLVGHPRNGGRLRCVVQSRRQVDTRELPSPGGKCVVPPRCGCPRLSGEHPLNHVLDECLLVGIRHPLWDEDDDSVALPVSGHRAGPPTAAANLDTRAARLGWIGCGGRLVRFTTISGLRPATSLDLPPSLRQWQRWLSHDVLSDATGHQVVASISARDFG